MQIRMFPAAPTRAILAAYILAMPCALAEDVRAGDLVMTQAWSRATPDGAKIAGGYLTIENKGSAPDRLIGGFSAIAGRIDVHEMAMNNGVMTMRQLDLGLPIEAGKTVTLAPGGFHLMLMDLKSRLKQGETVPVTLKFEKAGEVTVAFDVQGVGAKGPGTGTAGANPSWSTEKAALARPLNVYSAPATAQPDESFFTHLHTEKAMANITVSPGRAGPVEILIQLETVDERPLEATAVSVTLGNAQAGAEPVSAEAERTTDDQWRVRMSAPASGQWMLGLGITISASDKVSVESPILIR